MAVRKKTSDFISLLALFLFSLTRPIFATELLFFYEEGCPYSAKINDFLQKRIKSNYPLEIKAYEIHEPANARLMLDLARAYKAKAILEKGTPAVFISDKAFHGSSRLIQRKIEEAVREAIRYKADSPLGRLADESQRVKSKTQITLPVVIGAAAASAINPCTGAIVVLLFGTILVVSRRKKAVLGAGFSFTAACFISYFLIGIGLFTVVQTSGIQHSIYIAVSILAVLIGLWNAKDFFLRGRKFNVEAPEGWQPLIKRITSKIPLVLSAFIIGFLVSLFLLPCTSGPYIVIIGMLSNLATRMQAVWLLLLYNTVFVLPFIVITFAVGFGFTTTKKVDKWRQERLLKFRLITGLLMLALGMTLIILLLLGII